MNPSTDGQRSGAGQLREKCGKNVLAHVRPPLRCPTS
jgi:hypothetical protein